MNWEDASLGKVFVFYLIKAFGCYFFHSVCGMGMLKEWLPNFIGSYATFFLKKPEVNG